MGKQQVAFPVGQLQRRPGRFRKMNFNRLLFLGSPARTFQRSAFWVSIRKIVITKEVDPVGLLDAMGEPLRGAAGISRSIIPLVEKIAEEDRQVRLFATNGSLDPIEVARLVDVWNDDNLLADVHAWGDERLAVVSQD